MGSELKINSNAGTPEMVTFPVFTQIGPTRPSLLKTSAAEGPRTTTMTLLPASVFPATCTLAPP